MKKIKEFIPLIYNYSQQRLSTNGCIGSPANYRGQKLAFARRQILQQSSTLIVHLYFLQVVLSVLFFEKSTKNGAVVYGIRCFLCSQIASALAAAIFFSRFTPRRSLLVAMLGVARTRCAQTSCHLFPSIARLLTVPPNAALSLSATNYLLQWYTSRTIARAMLISNRNRHR